MERTTDFWLQPAEQDWRPRPTLSGRDHTSFEVWDQEQLRHRGTVSQVAPHLGVLWIVETTTGLPKMIQAQEYRLCFAPAQAS